MLDGKERPTVAARGDNIVRVLHAVRGSVPEELPFSAFTRRCAGYFAAGGCIIDQPFSAAAFGRHDPLLYGCR